MSADLNDLTSDFRAKVIQGIAVLAGGGLAFKRYFTLRDPVVQARLWRQSRSQDIVDAKLKELDEAKCDFIITCFDKAGPATGPWATNAIPGLSWHQYGKAVDCYLEDATGGPVWESPSYARYGQVADQNGMYWGGHFGDNDHWQDSRAEPLDVLGSLSRSMTLWP